MKGPLSRSSPTSFTPGKRDQQSSSAMALVWKSVGLWRVGCTAGAGSLPSGDGDTAAVLGGGGRCVLCVLLSTGLRGSPALCVHMSVRRASPVTWAGTVSGPHPCVKGSVRRRVNTIKTTDRGELLQKIRRMSNCFSTIKLLKKKQKKKPEKPKKQNKTLPASSREKQH